MDSSQTNLTNNFQSFINRFQTLGLDFHMAVTTTDAYRNRYQSNQNLANILMAFRRGHITGNASSGWSYSPDSLVSIMDSNTPSLSNVFLIDAKQGTDGSGDERAFSSFKDALNYSGNAGFRRPDAVLSIIIVSDEDDFSSNTSADIPDGDYDAEVNSDPIVPVNTGSSTDIYHLYQDPNLDTVQSYKTYLDGLVGAGNYTVNMIGVLDTTCKAQLNASYSGRRIGRRYMQLADLSGGVKTSLCDNFGDSLQLISDSIIELSSTFQLNREPVVSSIQVVVNGVSVPQDATNGWTYASTGTTWSVTFHGTAVPPEGANIQIYFTPVTADNG